MKTKKFPTLFKKSSKGKIEEWSVTVEKDLFFPCIKVFYGELGGKKQTKRNLIKKGLNVGKKNETSKEEQALKEAEAKWIKQKKKGYVESLEDAKAGKLDNLIKGGMVSMTANTYEEGDVLPYPVYVQFKLDGMRCSADNHRKSLWTRQRREITSCPHIIEELKKVMITINWGKVFHDGELYLHEYCDDFEKIMSAVRKKEPTKESAKIEYHIYDMFFVDEPMIPFKERMDRIQSLPDYVANKIKIVTTYKVNNEKELMDLKKQADKEGYEGLIIRNPHAPYEHKRTNNLLKFKSWKDAEFDIVNVNSGKDGAVVFTCKTEAGDTFEATKSGEKKGNQKYLKTSALWVGKKLCVKYVKMTKKNNVPKHATALYIRED